MPQDDPQATNEVLLRMRHRQAPHRRPPAWTGK